MLVRSLAQTAVVALLMTLASFSAHAQATRTWVSGVGDDVNPCSRTAPCKTFAGAISKTAANGIIDVLDPGGFGAVTITKGITIRAVGPVGSALAAFTNGININAPGATVSLIGLQIDGAGNGLNGVRVLSATQVNLKDCLIANFRGSPGIGLLVSSDAFARVTVSDSTIVGNVVGVDVKPTSSKNNGVLLDNVLVDGNSTADIRSDTIRSIVIMRRSTALGVITLTNSATLRSYGDNAFNVGASPVTQGVPLQ